MGTQRTQGLRVSLSAMSLQATFTRADVEIAPGATAFLELRVLSTAPYREPVSLIASGATASWATIQPRTLTLEPGEEQVVEVEVRPPRVPSTSSGPTSFSVRVVPHDHPDEATTAETIIVIAPNSDRVVTLLQPALGGRRRATYDVVVDNHGNTVASCRLSLVDHSGRLDAIFDPPSVGVEPGGGALVHMRLRAKHALWERRARMIPFRVDATQSGQLTASASGTFAQAPAIPRPALARTAAVLATIALLALAWFTLARPAIRNAARDAVDDALATTTTAAANSDPTASTAPGPSTGPGSSTPPTSSVDGSEATESLTRTLAVTTPRGETTTAEFTVPIGSTLRIRQLYLQNPRRDMGEARLLRGAETLFTWNLDDSIALDIPFVTPGVELSPGDRLTFEVHCAGVGDPSLDACVPSLTVLGTLVTAS